LTARLPAYQTTIIGSGDECVNPEGADADPKGQTYFYGDEFIASGYSFGTFYTYKLTVGESFYKLEIDSGSGFDLIKVEFVDSSEFDTNHRITLGQRYCDGDRVEDSSDPTCTTPAAAGGCLATGAYHSASIVGDGTRRRR